MAVPGTSPQRAYSEMSTGAAIRRLGRRVLGKASQADAPRFARRIQNWIAAFGAGVSARVPHAVVVPMPGRLS